MGHCTVSQQAPCHQHLPGSFATWLSATGIFVLKPYWDHVIYHLILKEPQNFHLFTPTPSLHFQPLSCYQASSYLRALTLAISITSTHLPAREALPHGNLSFYPNVILTRGLHWKHRSKWFPAGILFPHTLSFSFSLAFSITWYSGRFLFTLFGFVEAVLPAWKTCRSSTAIMFRECLVDCFYTVFNQVLRTLEWPHL